MCFYFILIKVSITRDVNKSRRDRIRHGTARVLVMYYDSHVPQYDYFLKTCHGTSRGNAILEPLDLDRILNLE